MTGFGAYAVIWFLFWMASLTRADSSGKRAIIVLLALLVPMAGVRPEHDRPHTDVRWDAIDPNGEVGSYGDYLLAKIARVFPDLGRNVLPNDGTSP